MYAYPRTVINLQVKKTFGSIFEGNIQKKLYHCFISKLAQGTYAASCRREFEPGPNSEFGISFRVIIYVAFLDTHTEFVRGNCCVAYHIKQKDYTLTIYMRALCSCYTCKRDSHATHAHATRTLRSRHTHATLTPCSRHALRSLYVHTMRTPLRACYTCARCICACCAHATRRLCMRTPYTIRARRTDILYGYYSACSLARNGAGARQGIPVRLVADEEQAGGGRATPAVTSVG